MWMFLAAVITALGLCIRSVYERNVFSTTIYTLRSDKIKRDRNLIFLTDLHNNCFGKDQRRLLAAIAKEEPDAVLIGGDMMIVHKDPAAHGFDDIKMGAEVDAALLFVKKLARRYPVYYANGNHESRLNTMRESYGDLFGRYMEELKQAGVCYLSDETADFEEDIRISGLELEEQYFGRRYMGDLEKGYIIKRLGRVGQDRFHILLAHSPKFFDRYVEWGADLTLAGHYHGGTIWLPWIGGVMTPQFEFLRKDCAGMMEKDGKCMIIGRGLGTHSINVRLNDMSQLMVIKLRAAD